MPTAADVRSLLLLALAFGLVSWPAHAADPCDAFTWKVTKERALFDGKPLLVPAGKDGATAPELAPGRLYELQLIGQPQVTFAASPGKKMLTDGGYAGLASVRLASSGLYRVSADTDFWIDVVSAGRTVRSKDFNGQQGCHAPHKIVEFELTAPGPYLLQFSGPPSPTVRVSITLVPPPVSK